MRILAVTDFYHPRSGGVERVVHETARRLPGLGSDVEVLTRRLTSDAAAETSVDGVRVWRVGPGPRPLPIELMAIGRELRSWCDQHLERFDLIHVHLPFVALPLLARARAARVPMVATFYGPWDREYATELADPGVPSRWPNWLRPQAMRIVAGCMRRWQRRVLAASRELIVLSRHSATELAELQPGRQPSEVPGGVDLERFQPRPADEARRRLGLGTPGRPMGRPLVVAVRRLVPRMGLDTLIDACARLRARHPELALVIAGSGPMAESLRRYAAERGFGSLRIVSGLSDEDLPWLYAAADVVAMPTRSLEGFGLPVLEAWACGIPVAGTSVGALAETIARLDPEFASPDDGSEGLATAMAEVLARRTPELAERARRLAESYGWERVAERLHAVYHRSMSQGSPA